MSMKNIKKLQKINNREDGENNEHEGKCRKCGE